MNKSELIKFVKSKINPQSDSLFMYTDPSYVDESEWDDEMKNSSPFDKAINDFLTGMSDYDGKSVFTQEEADHMVWCMETAQVYVGMKYDD